MLNGVFRTCAAIAIIELAALPALGQSDTKMTGLKRPVSTPAESASIAQHVLALFNKAGVHGGIAIVNEQCQEAVDQFPEFEGNLEGALQKLVATGHDLHWLQVGDGLVIHNTPSLPPLLTVVVREFQFSRKQALAKSSATLFEAPEVSDKARALKLVEYGPELGFAQLRQPDTPQDIVTLSNKTVVDALNSIAGNHAVWIYEESRCERNVMSLNWPVR